MNFILTEMTFLRYFIPLIIEANSRNIDCKVFIHPNNKYNNPLKYEDLLEDTNNTLMEDAEFDILLSSMKLDFIEQNFLRLRIEGLTMEEITQDLGESAYKIRHSLQEKVKFLI